MQTRQLGNSDLALTTIGLGTWAIGGGDWKFGWGPQDEDEAIGAVTRAADLGVNWIDTAPVYGDGRAEEIVGKALAKLGSSRRPMIATKCGRITRSPDEIVGVLKRDSILSECDASLRRLGVETIDLYQIHWPDPEADIEQAWETMRLLKDQGKVRQIAVSNHNVAQMKRLQPIHEVASLQPPYSMFTRGIEDEILPFCGQNKIGVVCYSPMCKGLLTGKLDRQRATALPTSDHRARDPKFLDPQLTINLDFVDGLKPIAERNGRTVAQLAIAWVLRRPEVTAAIVGARRPEQIETTVPAANWKLSEDDVRDIDALLETRSRQLESLGTIDTGRV